MPVEIMKWNDNVRFSDGVTGVEIDSGEYSKASCA
jgi:hypothetical protein